MILLFMIILLSIPVRIVGSNKETIIESPFYLRARIHDSRTVNVQFEIAHDGDQRGCQMYKFTVRHKDKNPYSMPQQNLTFWRNSLELKQLTFGNYRICAIICSEYLKANNSYDKIVKKKHLSKPITACVTIRVYRSHFLILTLYILVFIILVLSQIDFSLRKRKLLRAQIDQSFIDLKQILR
ncbi:unnamed protein product [Rotaria socialis]|uniref:Uncharacterized protein n=3 Tax=Rotaria socialis TaxID=392032 RepID=A0A817QCT9_9BILA|nr:unnamed protein product [Rotaria socialis]CAF3331467.1 unnamed protein product [Rotaria socialis]CAF3693869.1 unnamed protein product [Rotaria socialis]